MLKPRLRNVENLPRNVIVQLLKLTRQLFALNGLPESAVRICILFGMKIIRLGVKSE